jgi:hypothetical protein
MDFQSVEDYTDNLSDKSCSVKSKNTNDTDQINPDFSTVLDLNHLPQFRMNDKNSKYYYLLFIYFQVN